MVVSKVDRTASCVRNMAVERLESLILLQVHTDKTPSTDDVLDCFVLLQAHTDKTPSTDDVLDCFASNSARRFNLIMFAKLSYTLVFYVHMHY